MLKLPKGLKKKKKKIKKDQDLFTEEELEEYKRQLKSKQGDTSDSATTLNVEGLTPTDSAAQSTSDSVPLEDKDDHKNLKLDEDKAVDVDDEWAKFKALTSGVDSILHKTQDELDRIKKESFYQRLPTAVEKKCIQEEEVILREGELIEEDKRKAAQLESQRDKLAEAVVELSEFEDEEEIEVDDIFVTDYIDAITSGEVQLSVVPDSPVFENTGPDPFDTEYAEKIIVGADKVKDNKKLVPLGAAVEVLSGRVEREKALELAKPKRKLRKGIKNLLLSESIDLGEYKEDIKAPEPQAHLFDELVNDVPELNTPIDLSVSLHLNFIQEKNFNELDEESKENTIDPDLTEFDVLKIQDDDEFDELAVESLSKKDKVNIITEVSLPKVVSADWAEFKQESNNLQISEEPIVPEDEEDVYQTEDIFNTAYVDQIIKKTTVLEEDENFDPRAEETIGDESTYQPNINSENCDPFDTSSIINVHQPEVIAVTSVKNDLLRENSLKNFVKKPDSDIIDGEIKTESSVDKFSVKTSTYANFDIASRKSSLSLNIQPKSVGFLVPEQEILGVVDGGNNKKPLTPFYATVKPSLVENSIEDPFDTSFVPETKPTAVELKHLENDLLQNTIKRSLSDPDFDPRAPSTPILAEDLLTVKEEISAKVLTPAQENKNLLTEEEHIVDPFDTSIAANIKPGHTELKLLESELLPPLQSAISTGVIDTQSDAQELGLGDKVLTPLLPIKQPKLLEEVDPFDTSIAENLGPGQVEIKLLESELIGH